MMRLDGSSTCLASTGVEFQVSDAALPVLQRQRRDTDAHERKAQDEMADGIGHQHRHRVLTAEIEARETRGTAGNAFGQHRKGDRAILQHDGRPAGLRLRLKQNVVEPVLHRLRQQRLAHAHATGHAAALHTGRCRFRNDN
jgi:hypothetical protein